MNFKQTDFKLRGSVDLGYSRVRFWTRSPMVRRCRTASERSI